jgi:hypothetical protein
MVAIRKQVLRVPRYIELYKIKESLRFFWKEPERSRRAAKKALEPLRVPVGRT